MNKPIFVIIPVYNAERYLENAVQSVLNQPNVDTQVILVNDGSRDSSGEICNRLSFSDARICVVHQENGGVSKARNTGIDLALEKTMAFGDDAYIAFLDADDLWKKNMKWAADDGEDADIIAYSSAYCNAKGNRYCIIHRFENGIMFGDGANTAWVTNGHFGAFLFHAGFLRKNRLRFIEGVIRNEDIIFWKQATFAARKIVFLSEVLYVYRMHSTSVTHSGSIDHVVSLHIPNAWKQAEKWVHSLPDSTQLQKERWTEICSLLVGTRLLENVRSLAEYGRSTEEIKTVLLNSPLTKHLEDLEVEYLSDWQKSDLLMFRDDFEGFVRFYKKRGRLLRIGIVIRNLPIIRGIIDHRKYSLMEI